MKKTGSPLLYTACGAMLIMILDNRSAFRGAIQGVQLCLQSVIPALFPMMVLSIFITAGIRSAPMRFLKPLGKLCRIPYGCEPVLAVGYLGGYPSGAQSIAIAQQEGLISTDDGRRMLAFCNNAGPAFIFGMVGPMFSRWYIPWVLWGIHMISALAVGMILPAWGKKTVRKANMTTISFSQALHKGVDAITTVCAWVILFRIVITFSEKWILRVLPEEFQVWIVGALELTNGCLQLTSLENEGFRFITASVLLAFGGVCVSLQTKSVATNIPMDLYFPGKGMQSLLSFLLSYVIQLMLFSDSWRLPTILWLFLGIMALLILIAVKNRGSIPKKIGV